VTDKKRMLYNEKETITTIKNNVPTYDAIYPYTSTTLKRDTGKVAITGYRLLSYIIMII
jgi:hypothetical protein